MPTKPKDVAPMSTRSTRNMSRELRSASPFKSSAPSAVQNRPKATPRKSRVKKNIDNKSTKQTSESDGREINDSDDQPDGETLDSSTGHENQQSEVEIEDELPQSKKSRSPKKRARSQDRNVEPGNDEAEEIAGENDAAEPLPSNTVRVSVHSDVRDDGKTETTRTTVKVEMPTDAPDMDMPQDATEMIEKAREMVMTAQALQETSGEGQSGAPASSERSRKRKAEELELDDVEEIVEVDGVRDDVGNDRELEARPAKRQRVMVPAIEYRREKIQKRALVGLTATFALG